MQNLSCPNVTQPSCAWFGSVSSLQNAYMQSKSRFTNLRIRLFFYQINRRSHLLRRQHGSWPASPKSISISSSVLEEQNCKQEVNEEPSRVIYYRRPARTSRETVCSGVLYMQHSRMGNILQRSDTAGSRPQMTTASDFVLVKKTDTQWKINFVLYL